jgi:hypothetical protein
MKKMRLLNEKRRLRKDFLNQSMATMDFQDQIMEDEVMWKVGRRGVRKMKLVNMGPQASIPIEHHQRQQS